MVDDTLSDILYIMFIVHPVFYQSCNHWYYDTSTLIEHSSVILVNYYQKMVLRVVI